MSLSMLWGVKPAIERGQHKEIKQTLLLSLSSGGPLLKVSVTAVKGLCNAYKGFIGCPANLSTAG